MDEDRRGDGRQRPRLKLTGLGELRRKLELERQQDVIPQDLLDVIETDEKINEGTYGAIFSLKRYPDLVAKINKRIVQSCDDLYEFAMLKRFQHMTRDASLIRVASLAENMNPVVFQGRCVFYQQKISPPPHHDELVELVPGQLGTFPSAVGKWKMFGLVDIVKSMKSEFGIASNVYAYNLGTWLADVHFAMHVIPFDVEFFLGTAAAGAASSPSTKQQGQHQGQHQGQQQEQQKQQQEMDSRLVSPMRTSSGRVIVSIADVAKELVDIPPSMRHFRSPPSSSSSITMSPSRTFLSPSKTMPRIPIDRLEESPHHHFHNIPEQPGSAAKAAAAAARAAARTAESTRPTPIERKAERKASDVYRKLSAVDPDEDDDDLGFPTSPSLPPPPRKQTRANSVKSEFFVLDFDKVRESPVSDDEFLQSTEVFKLLKQNLSEIMFPKRYDVIVKELKEAEMMMMTLDDEGEQFLQHLRIFCDSFERAYVDTAFEIGGRDAQTLAKQVLSRR